jgi:P-type E1-E2 ATPase
MLTGDRQERANVIAGELGIRAIAELLPDQKLACIEAWKQEGRKVLMIGDGLNDGPALAAAHVGVALGCGADLSRELADVCLLGNDLTRLPEILKLSRETVRTIRWNLLWAFGYNAIGVLLAAGGLLHPIVAAIAMVGSSVLVVSNSLRLASSEEAPTPRKQEGPRALPQERSGSAHRPECSPAPTQLWGNSP